jgi:hypothetical protein
MHEQHQPPFAKPWPKFWLRLGRLAMHILSCLSGYHKA